MCVNSESFQIYLSGIFYENLTKICRKSGYYENIKMSNY